jgi:hypothetical protein
VSDANKVAIAGIAATALVGLAGIAGSWYSASETRSSQLKIARLTRGYDNRATTYIDAIQMLNDVRKRTQQPMLLSTHKQFHLFVQEDQALDLRMYAYGSRHVYNLWTDLSTEPVNLQNDVTRKPLDFSLNLRKFDANFKKLLLMVHGEVSPT